LDKNSSMTHDWNSQLALRVIGLKDHSASFTEDDLPFDPPGTQLVGTCGDKMAVSAFCGSFLMLLLSALVFTLITFCRRGKRLETSFQRTASFIQGLSTFNAMNPHSILKKTTSAAPTSHNPDFVRSLSEGRRRALPSIPLPSGSSSRESEKRPKSEVAQLLHQLGNEGSEYECISNENMSSEDSESAKDKEVYIVYCCKDSKRRSRSAPPTTRGGKSIMI
jgi:hypothetical protein